jgi:hypothetical protein
MISAATPSKDAMCTTGDPGDCIGQEVGKPTPSFATPPQDIFAHIGQVTPMDKVRKPTPSVATPFFATSPQDTIFGTSELRNAIGHDFGKTTPPKDATFAAGEPPDAIANDAGKPTPNVVTPIVETPPKTPYLAWVSLEIPLNTKLENRRQASRRPTGAIFGINELRNAVGHDGGKPTPRDAIFCAGVTRDATEDDVGKQRQASRRQSS